MKLSDYVIDFVARQGVRHVFTVTGGAVAHLIDSAAAHPTLDFVCNQHEQAAAMAADGYARTSGNLGVAMATSGPGATNLMTGICCAYYDSIPTLFLTGQVATFRSAIGKGVRQLGFQETRVVEMMRHITKHSVMVTDPARIRYELEHAVWLARSGRPGPVLLDIPDNLQREQIEPDELEAFIPPAEAVPCPSADELARLIAMFAQAQRPVLVFGAGVQLAGARQEAKELAQRLGWPVLLTWALMDLLPWDDRLRVGNFGTSGSRYGNFTVQNADLVLSIGSRLDTHATGSPVNYFARQAHKVVVDIDAAELAKFSHWGLSIDLPIAADAGAFLRALLAADWKTAPVDAWHARIADWKARYPMCPPAAIAQSRWVNPYAFVDQLSDHLRDGEVVVVDTGCALPQSFNTLRTKNDQRLFSAFNNTPMGYALPAAIGASFARQRSRVICLTGDGGLQMNIQELATIAKHRLPIKIFVFNNHGYSMIKETQNQWLGARHHGSSVESGLPDPDPVRIAQAYDIEAVAISHNHDLPQTLEAIFANDRPQLCNLNLCSDDSQFLLTKFGRPIEDIAPLLDRNELAANMYIPPVDC